MQLASTTPHRLYGGGRRYEGRVGLAPWLPSFLRAGDSSSESPLAFSFSVPEGGGEPPSPASADFWLLEELLPSSRLGLHRKENDYLQPHC